MDQKISNECTTKEFLDEIVREANECVETNNEDGFVKALCIILNYDVRRYRDQMLPLKLRHWFKSLRQEYLNGQNL